MIHGYGSGLLDLGLERYIILALKWHLVVEGGSSLGKLIWAPKQRLTVEAGSVFTGSLNIAKCFNILQDITLALWLWVRLEGSVNM
jgi:hypothetical protein